MIGSSVTFGVGWITSHIFSDRRSQPLTAENVETHRGER
jgi:hypothetical protein